jgi:hypothetical protein
VKKPRSSSIGASSFWLKIAEGTLGQDGLRLNQLRRIKKARPKPGHPYEQRAITATQSETRGCPPQSDG